MPSGFSATIILVALGATIDVQAAAAQPQDVAVGEYRSVITTGGDARRASEMNWWIASVRDPQGIEAYTVRMEVPFDVPFPSITLAPGGESVVIDACRGLVEFYSRTGVRVGMWEPFASRVPNYERIIKCAAAQERVAFLLSSPEASVVRIEERDLNGAPLASAELAGRGAGEIIRSSDGSFILAGTTDPAIDGGGRTFLLSRELSRRGEHDLSMRSAAFSDDGGRYVVADRWSIVYAEAGKEVFQWRVDSPERLITAVALSGDRCAVVVETIAVGDGPPLFHDAGLVVVDGSGVVVEERITRGASRRPARLSVEAGDFVLRSENREIRIHSGTRDGE